MIKAVIVLKVSGNDIRYSAYSLLGGCLACKGKWWLSIEKLKEDNPNLTFHEGYVEFKNGFRNKAKQIIEEWK